MMNFHNSSLLFFNIAGNSIITNLMYNTLGLLFSIGGIKAPQNINLKTKKISDKILGNAKTKVPFFEKMDSQL